MDVNSEQYTAMKIDLKKKSLLNESEAFQVLIDERLPHFIAAPVELTCRYEVKQMNRILLLRLMQRGFIKTECQRCLATFEHDFVLESEMAVCRSEEIASAYQETYDVIVAADDQIELKDLLIDNLYLFSASVHQHIELCDRNQIKLMLDD